MTDEDWPFRSTFEHGTAARARAVAERRGAAERASAARTVAGRAHDGSDLQMLLSMLGLHPGDGPRHNP